MPSPTATARRPASPGIPEFGPGERRARPQVVPYADAHLPDHPARVPHRHAHLELLWLAEGSGELLLDLRRVPFGPRSLVFVAAGRVHAWDHRAPPRGTLLMLPHSLLQADAGHPGLLGRLRFLNEAPDPVLHLDPPDAEETAWLFAEALAASSRPDADTDTVLRAFAILVLVRIRRILARRSGTAGLTAAPASPFVQRFQLLLERHFTNHTRVYEYARLLGVSRTHLNEELLRETGRPASAHIAARVLLEAKRLLVHSPLPVAAVSAALRFRDPSYFGRQFRLHTGMTPAAYRAAARVAAQRGAA